MKLWVWLFLQVIREEAVQKLGVEEKVPMRTRHTGGDRDSDLCLCFSGFTETDMRRCKGIIPPETFQLLFGLRSLVSFATPFFLVAWCGDIMITDVPLQCRLKAWSLQETHYQQDERLQDVARGSKETNLGFVAAISKNTHGGNMLEEDKQEYDVVMTSLLWFVLWPG